MATNYTVRPDGNLFLIEELRADGSYRQLARYATDDEAHRRVKVLQERDAGIAAANAKLDPNGRTDGQSKRLQARGDPIQLGKLIGAITTV